MNSDQTGVLEQHLSRTAQDYEALPYESKPFVQTHPSRLAAIAHLFGLEAVPVENARILELGCAAGGNIIPVAAYFPGSYCLGIDYSDRQVIDGQARVASLGLDNVEIRQASITELAEDIGEFDYIISHGVYSWVPEVVQKAILDVSAKHLSPNGIAYVSYNVLPGWRINQPLREALNLLVPEHLDAAARVAMSRRLLNFMKDATPVQGPYGEVLRQAPEKLAAYSDDYIFHEYLEAENLPVSFRDFQTAASAVGLGYLGEADIQTMIASNMGAEFAKKVEEATTNDIVTREQMFDVLTGRPFRQTLLVKGERLNSINRRLMPDRVEGLHFTGLQNPRIEKAPEGAKLVEDRGLLFFAGDKGLLRLAERLTKPAPGSFSYESCVEGMDAAERESARNALFRMVVSGILRASVDPMTAAGASFMPRASRIAMADAKAGMTYTTNARHENVQLDATTMVLLPHLDGKFTRRDMEQKLLDAAKAGTITFNQNNAPITDAGRLRSAVQAYLPRLLNSIASTGILEA